ncbi:MAG TPA: hypothetical protein VGO47_11005, partial [Chlamydiales bacterium]|nr:hypothetical protein [Chlamydiales bacterium]
FGTARAAEEAIKAIRGNAAMNRAIGLLCVKVVGVEDVEKSLRGRLFLSRACRGAIYLVRRSGHTFHCQEAPNQHCDCDAILLRL